MLSGSISPVASARRLLDGIRGHQALQAIPAEGAQNEVSVSGTVCSKNIELTVYGRIDRLYGDERVEEIKTITPPPSSSPAATSNTGRRRSATLFYFAANAA
jgi:hypothetical protein